MADAEWELVEQVRQGDEAAWQYLIETYAGRLQAFARSRLQDTSLAEDIVQETLIGFLTSLANYDETRTPLETFLFRIAAYKITDVLRKRGRRPALHPIEDPVTLAGRDRRASSLARSREQGEQQRNQLQEQLAAVLEEWKRAGQFERLKVCELLYVRGWPNKQVAQALQLTEQQVANHKQALATRLKQIPPRS